MRRALYLAVLLVGCSRKEKLPPPPPAALVEPAPKEATIASALVPPAAAPSPVPAEPASLRGKKVLHVGDSMVGGNWGLTRALEAKLEPEGAKVVRHTKVSETLASMDKDPTLKDLLRTHEPDIVIITLGTNDTDVPHPEVYAKHVANIAKRVAPRECWWMGPPKDAPVNKVIKENSAPCKFFDSSTLVLDRTKDGIHPSDKGGGQWASAFWTVFRAPNDPKP
jgi:lysophospholipase L1-like esterase